MTKKHSVEQPFKYFGWDEDPIGKYKQPISNPDMTGSGYPQTDIDKAGVMVKGRWPAGIKTKKKMEMKGTGAAEKGKKFYEDD